MQTNILYTIEYEPVRIHVRGNNTSETTEMNIDGSNSSCVHGKWGETWVSVTKHEEYAYTKLKAIIWDIQAISLWN